MTLKNRVYPRVSALRDNQYREIQRKGSFHWLFCLLNPGEILVGEFFHYTTKRSREVVIKDAETLRAWRCSVDAGAHHLNALYAVKVR